MRVSRQYRTASKSNYNRFCNENPTIKVTYKEYTTILSVCNKKFITDAIETGSPIVLPYGFGQVVVSKYKKKTYRLDNDGNRVINYPIDWVETNKVGYHVYNMNFHSDGYSVKWKWLPSRSKLYQTSVWVMKPTRASSRLLAKYIITDKEYLQLYNQY